MGGTLDFEFRWGKRGGTPRDPETPFHVAILGAFAGENPTDPQKAIPVDAETFEGVLARLAPRVTVAGVGTDGGPYVHGIARLDDFHPDALLETVPALSALSALRRTVADTKTFSEIAAEIVSAKGVEPAPAKPERNDETLERLLGRRSPRSVAEASAKDAVDRLAREAVAPHIVATPDPRQADWLKAIDTALADRLRSVLRQPAFRALEGLWRGVHRLVSRVDVGGPVHVHLVPVAIPALRSDLAACGSDARASRLHRILETTRTASGIDRFDLLVVSAAFGTSTDDLAAIEGLAALAESSGTTALASADPSLVGATSVGDLGDPTTWSKLPAASAERWEAIRRLPAARRVALALPGVLARGPYGTKTDPIAAFAFEEAADRPGTTGFCWTSAAVACAEAVVDAAAQENPEPLALVAAALGDLPFGIFEAPDGRHLQPCVEVLLPDRAAERLLDAGLTPIVGHAQRPDVRILRLQPIGN